MAKPVLFKLHNAPEGIQYANLSGDYSYLNSGYYHSLDAELASLGVIPTSQEILDAYVVPLAMEKARIHELAIPHYEIITDKLPPPPMMAYPINPFFSTGELITEKENLEQRRKALSMTGKYAVLCQKLEGDYRIDVVRCIMGKCLNESYRIFAKDVFEIFRIPLMRIRVIVVAKEYQLSAIEPLTYEDLTLNEKKFLSEMGSWQT